MKPGLSIWHKTFKWKLCLTKTQWNWGGAVIFLAALANWALPFPYPAWRRALGVALWLLVTIALIGLAAQHIKGLGRLFEKPVARHPVTLVLALILLVFVGFNLYHMTESDRPPLQLYALYQRDFQQYYLSLGLNAQLLPTKAGSRSVAFNFRVYGDTDSASKFVAIYIPRSTRTYEICSSLSHMVPALIKKVLSRSTARISDPADLSRQDLDKLNFTGKVFLYYEGDFHEEQTEALKRLYKSNNLSVQLRGENYAAIRSLQEPRPQP